MLDPVLDKKLNQLETILASLRSAVVAFSGGVDSTLLLCVAQKVLQERVLAVHIHSPLSSREEQADCERLASHFGSHLHLVPLDELQQQEIRENSLRRCYFCKKMRLQCIADYAESEGIPWILDGSNVDDLNDYRPGMQALKEIPNARSPLVEAGLNKADIRALLRFFDVPDWNKPAAACLASRISYGTPLHLAALQQIDAAERLLRQLLPPYTQLRVRHHGDLARIEVAAEGLQALIASRLQLITEMKKLGYRYVTVDLALYQMSGLDYN